MIAPTKKFRFRMDTHTNGQSYNPCVLSALGAGDRS